MLNTQIPTATTNGTLPQNYLTLAELENAKHELERVAHALCVITAHDLEPEHIKSLIFMAGETLFNAKKSVDVAFNNLGGDV